MIKNHLWVYIILCLTVVSAVSNHAVSQTKIQFEISPLSTLALSGKSTVNGFRCELKNNFCSTKQLVTTEITDDLLKLDGAELEIVIKNFDCANERMNKDMQGALKAEEFPSMILKIMEINYNGGIQEILKSRCATALAEITLGGVSKCIVLNFSDIEFKDHRLSFTGNQEINMEEFDIEPPQVLLGLIKVHEMINIDFNLMVDLH